MNIYHAASCFFCTVFAVVETTCQLDNRDSTTSCTNKPNTVVVAAQFPEANTKSNTIDQMCYITLHCFSRLPSSLYLSRMMAKDKENNQKAHILLCPQGKRIYSSAAKRKPLKGSIICRSGRGVTRLGPQWTNGE